MFFPVKTPNIAEAHALWALRVSLNAPVVDIEGFAVAPALAAIALGDGDDGNAELAIAVRSERTGQVIFFAPDQELDAMGSPAVAFDAALSFAESMGFLFDDDEVATRGAEPAAATWQGIVAGAEPPERSLGEPASGPPDPVSEFASAPELPPEPRVPDPVPAAPAAPAAPARPRSGPADRDLLRWGPEALELDFGALEIRRAQPEPPAPRPPPEPGPAPEPRQPPEPRVPRESRARELLLEEIAPRAASATPRLPPPPVEPEALRPAPPPAPVTPDPAPAREVANPPPLPEGEMLPLSKFRVWTAPDEDRRLESAVATALADDEAAHTQTREDSDLAIRLLGHF